MATNDHKKYFSTENYPLECISTPEHNSFANELRNAILARNILTARTRKKVVNSLEDISKSKEESRRIYLREKAVNEILSSEKTYMHQLELILKYFINPIREKKILSYDDFTTIFGSIDTLYNVNRELLNELEKDSVNIAASFLKLAPFFKIYSVYAYDYRKSLLLLQELEGKNRGFAKFLENQESRPEVSQKLSALLITPIQRIPRYRLLLKEVLAYTAQSDADFDLLKESLTEVERAAFHINSLVEEQENTQRLLELQRSLCNQKPSVVKPGRKLIKEGYVMKMQQNGAHGCQRYLIVLSDIILYCKLVKNKPSDPNSLQCRCILPLHKCRITEVSSKGVFTITCQNENLILYCEPANDVAEWISVLQEAVRKCIECRKTLRKASSSRKPARKREILVYDENSIVPRHQLDRKRRYPQKALENVTNHGSIESLNTVKRFRVNSVESSQLEVNHPIETITEQQDEELVTENINTYGLQKHVHREETIYSKVRGYFWGVGKSMKKIFGR